MKDLVRAIFEAGLAAADPGQAVAAALPDLDLGDPVRLSVVAVGKAAPRMIAPVLDLVTPARAIVVTHEGNEIGAVGAQVMRAEHPVPDTCGLRAANTLCDLAAGLGADDHLLVLISGGASAMLPAPRAGLSLEDKIAVTRDLLRSGAPIEDMNLVRQQLSRLKGGGLTRLAAPARVTALVLSDVIGDDMRAVASGPTLPPLGTVADARRILQDYDVWNSLPEAVRALLNNADAGAGPVPDSDTRLVGSNSLSVSAMARAAQGATVLDPPLTGDVAAAAARIAALPSGLWIAGGECTVHLVGQGMGGRNQELALRVAMIAEEQGWPEGWCYLQAGSDGRDGPTDAAGALVDGQTLKRMRAAGCDPAARLADNDSYHALVAANDLLIIGATGTNVADLGVFYRP